MKQWVFLIAQYFISLGLHQSQYCTIACANLMIKGYFKFSYTPDGNDSERISLFISAGWGNLLWQPQLTFLILPALQWILVPVFHIAVVSIIVLLHTSWEHKYSAAINTKYGEQGSQWNTGKPGTGKYYLLFRYTINFSWMKPRIFWIFSQGHSLKYKTSKTSDPLFSPVYTEIVNKYFRNKSKWPVLNSVFFKHSTVNSHQYKRPSHYTLLHRLRKKKLFSQGRVESMM